MERSKEQLVRVFNWVCRDIQDGGYENSYGEFVKFPNFSRLKKESRMYDELPKLKDVPYFSKTEIYCQNIDSYLKAIEMGSKCAVLNMASARNPGGGVASGSRAQEEELCRRSNLIYSLYSYTSLGRKLFGFDNTSKNTYPIPHYGGIYSPYVTIYKKANTYENMDNPKQCSVISCSGIVHPTIDEKTGLMLKRYERPIKRKIREILRIAIVNNHSKLVLGAFGCGAFKNPPKQVANLFKEVLEEDEFSHSFEEICFAIIEDNNSKRLHNPEGNLKPFSEVFGLKVI